MFLWFWDHTTQSLFKTLSKHNRAQSTGLCLIEFGCNVIDWVQLDSTLFDWVLMVWKSNSYKIQCLILLECQTQSTQIGIGFDWVWWSSISKMFDWLCWLYSLSVFSAKEQCHLCLPILYPTPQYPSPGQQDEQDVALHGAVLHVPSSERSLTMNLLRVVLKKLPSREVMSLDWKKR